MKDKDYKWQRRYIDLAAHVATWSKDPSRKIGAVAIGSKGQVLSQGYNGFPRGVDDSEERYANKQEKYKHVVHAEMNVIYNASYSGVSLHGADLYVYGLPVCSECAKGIIQVGIKHVVVRTPPDQNRGHWDDMWIDSVKMFEEAGVTYQWIDHE